MLTTLISLLEGNPEGLSLFEISRLMNVQPSALRSMLELLVRKGRLVEVGPDGKVCAVCGLESNCHLLAIKGKRYIACG